MTKLETLKYYEQDFKNKNSSEAYKVIFGILIEIKRNGKLNVDDTNQFLFELNCLKRDTIDHIVHQIKYRQKQFIDKHINYFRQTIQNLATEPKKVYVSSKLRVNI
jgi:hypothetical protein